MTDTLPYGSEDFNWYPAEYVVRLAAMQMDRAKPDWFRNIDPLTFDIGRTQHCVCGQNDIDYQDHAGIRSGNPLWAAYCDSEAEPFWLEEIAKRLPVAEPARVLA